MKKAVIVITILVIAGVAIYFIFGKSSSKQPVAMKATNIPTQSQAMKAQPQVSGQYPRPSGASGRRFGNMPADSKPIFGQVTTVIGNTVTVQRMSRSGSGTTITV